MEKNERRRDAQLAYSDEFSFQNEFTFEENKELAMRFLQENFVSKGLICDYAVHDPEREPGGTPNPHMHVLIPMRAIEPNGLFGKKERMNRDILPAGMCHIDDSHLFAYTAISADLRTAKKAPARDIGAVPE